MVILFIATLENRSAFQTRKAVMIGRTRFISAKVATLKTWGFDVEIIEEFRFQNFQSSEIVYNWFREWFKEYELKNVMIAGETEGFYNVKALEINDIPVKSEPIQDEISTDGKARVMLDKGIPGKQIAKELGLSEAKVSRIKKQMYS